MNKDILKKLIAFRDYEDREIFLEQLLKNPPWIKTADRNPTEEDRDCNGEVWVYVHAYDYCETQPAQLVNADRHSHWKPTGLVEPKPPEEE